MYHNIVNDSAPVGHDLQGITVRERVFKWQLKILNIFFNIIPLQDYIAKTKKGKKNSLNTISITIDDGTWQTYQNGSKIWNKLNVPVTIFVNTCHLDDGPLIWGSYLNALCFENLYDTILVENHTYELKSINDKFETKKKLHTLSLEAESQDSFFNDLNLKYPIKSEIKSYYSGMSSKQLQDASNNLLVTIGAHTHTHPSLDVLSAEDQANEIQMSKIILEKKIGKPITDFAYPSGFYNRKTIAILKKMQFTSACAVVPKYLEKDFKQYELPRLGIYRKDKLGFILVIIRGMIKNRLRYVY
ncbi:MAG: peptidoglycan/xylan/chitin deacetylase (PgdA/CDA1 family) [Urechidicola sp.]|jgi:peptidoglycan/xylan/chitin deacetylase (PgdA/CDA1 family)